MIMWGTENSTLGYSKWLHRTLLLRKKVKQKLENKYTKEELYSFKIEIIRNNNINISYTVLIDNIGEDHLLILDKILDNYEDIPLYINTEDYIIKTFIAWLLKVGH